LYNWAYRYSFSRKENEEKTNVLQRYWQLVMRKKEAVAEMIDREKVLTWLEICGKNNDCSGCCPYSENGFGEYGQCRESLMADAYDLLKEQDAVKPVLDEQTGRIWLCGNCGSYVGFEDNDPNDPNEFDKYCRECGHPVSWKGLVKWE